ncbi:MAG: GNAT family N-acetyltransferase [Proteobacteria bacterium]|nr:GNAT family N-acetyltransferase [Pseudomonadota bacterium]
MTSPRPDLPRWVEANAIAADPASWREAGVIGNDAARLMVVVADDPPLAALIALVERRADCAILTASEAIAAALPRFTSRAILHTLDDPDAIPDVDGAIVLPEDASLAHVPPALAEELTRMRPTRTIWCAYVDGEPVAFAYAPWRTAAWFDVSIDVLSGARQLGLGTIVAAAMLRDERAHGRAPVWGADEANAASLRLAARLGFTPIDHLHVGAPA